MRIAGAEQVASGWRYRLIDDGMYVDGDGQPVAGERFVFVSAAAIAGQTADGVMAAIASALAFDPTAGIAGVDVREWAQAKASGAANPIADGVVKATRTPTAGAVRKGN